jgi:hypothetical protein
MLSISGDQNLYFRYQEFDSNNIYISSSGPCVVRFLAGAFLDRSYGNINKSYPLVAPSSGSSSSGVIKAGLVSAGAFSGSPKKYTVVFTDDFPSTDYVISICGVDSRNFSYESKSISGFVINTGANAALSDEVSWEAVGVGESSSSRSIKAGIIDPSDFSGTPKKCSVAFTTPFATTDYVISIAGVDSRDFSYESKLTTGFTINTNANTALAAEVSWNATVVGES